MESTKIIVFKGKKIRKTIFKNEWWFSVVDVIAVLTDSANSRDYWYKMKIRVKDDDGVELSTFCRQLKVTTRRIQQVFQNWKKMPGPAVRLPEMPVSSLKKSWAGLLFPTKDS